MSEQPYQDDDLVYVDPDTRTVKGRVQWSQEGNPVPLPTEEGTAQQEPRGKVRRRERVRFYPWTTYRTAKRVYRVEGREKQEGERLSLDTAIAKALQEPYWD